MSVRWQRRLRRSRLLATALLLAFAAAVTAAATWLYLKDRKGWTASEVRDTAALAAAVVTTATGGLSQIVLAEWSDERKTSRSPGSRSKLDRAELDQWQDALSQAILARRVRGRSSQLSQMVQSGPVFDLNIAEAGRQTGVMGTHLRVMIRDKKVPLEAIKAEWDANPGRLVILGPPGYGKTVTSLSLLAHINLTRKPGTPVAELFSLNDWYQLSAERQVVDIEGWLVATLVNSYPELDMPRSVARSLILDDRVVPIFDGLDEVPEAKTFRRQCKQQIDEFAGRVSPYRSFVITCREHEYRKLAPDWVSADRHIRLLGLEPDDVIEILEERTVLNREWQEVCRRIRAGDKTLSQLFESPLRLAIALQAFRSDGSVAVLVGATRAEAEARLWDCLLDSSHATFARASSSKLRSWLRALALGMRRDSQLRLHLADFELYDHYGITDHRVFRRTLRGVLCGIVFATSALTASSMNDLDIELFVGVTYAAFAASFLILYRAQLVGRARAIAIHLGAVDHTLSYLACLAAVGGSLFILGSTGPSDNPLVAAAAIAAMAGVLHVAACSRWFSGRAPISRRRGPMAELTTARNRGLVTLFGVSLVSSTLCALTLYLPTRSSGAIGGAIIIGSVVGLVFGLESGLDFWLFFGWFRYRLSLAGALPRRLPQFLAWCADTERGWLRQVSDAYEFRHRELLDHLAADWEDGADRGPAFGPGRLPSRGLL